MRVRNEDYQQFLFIVFYMYLIQGLPYGIQAKFIPIYLRKRGYSLTQVGIMKLLYLPLILRTFYAPIMQLYMHKKIWLQISVILLFLNCVGLTLITERDTTLLNMSFLFMNLFCSIQDVALDSLALATPQCASDVINCNTAQVVGYKIGSLCGGGILLTLSEHLHWNTLFIFMSGFYLFGVLLTVFCRSFKLQRFEDMDTFNGVTSTMDNRTQTQIYSPEIIVTQSSRTVTTLLQMIRDSVVSVPTFFTIIYLIIYKMGEQGATNMLPLFLIDKKFKVAPIGFWIGVVGQIVSIAGSALAAVYMSFSRSTYHAILYLTLIIAPLISLMVLIVTPGYLDPTKLMLVSCVSSTINAATAVLLVNCIYLVSGVLTTATFTIMMQCSQTRPLSLQTTHYTVLATLEILGKLLFSSSVGFFTDRYGYVSCYMLFSALSWSSCLFLICFRKHFTFSAYYFNVGSLMSRHTDM